MNLKYYWAKNIINNNSRNLRETLNKHKKYLLCYFFVIAFLLCGIYVIFNNYNWYHNPVAKIISVENSFDHEEKGNNGEVEKYYNQQIVATLLNGDLKGLKVGIKNVYSSSKVFDSKYDIGDEVFITLNTNNGDLTGTISGLKRDKYIAILFAILFLLILVIAKKRGLFTILSLIINIFIFCFALDLYKKGTNILFLSNWMIILFSSISLLLINGFRKSTFIAILSTLASIGCTMIILKIVMISTDGIDYGFMEYITSPNDLAEIFMSQILLGGLGATMDVSITMASTVSELIFKDSNISLENLIKSGRELGHDIMGTMINVMLFTYLCGSIPLIILKMKSNMRLITIIFLHMPVEINIFLLGAIGILLTIPISLFISLIVFKRLRRTA